MSSATYNSAVTIKLKCGRKSDNMYWKEGRLSETFNNRQEWVKVAGINKPFNYTHKRLRGLFVGGAILVQ